MASTQIVNSERIMEEKTGPKKKSLNDILRKINFSVTLPAKQTTGTNDGDEDLPPREYKILPIHVIVIFYGHVCAFYGLYDALTVAKWSTLFFGYVVGVMGLIGVMAGARRLWSHRSYKAALPMQILLMVMYTFSFQFTAFNWVRDHRMHHKYCDTDADPHNSRRGFFFCHMGWLMAKKHPEMLSRVHTIDMSDAYNNPVLMFQKKYRFPLATLLCLVLPTLIPVYLWQEDLEVAWHITMLRYIITSHGTASINSFAHMWGSKPYDKSIRPTQNWFVSLVAVGEGWHNYHHVFPWDYRAAEFGNNWLNPASLFIDACAWVGWATELKSAPERMVVARASRTGDGTDLWGNILESDKGEITNAKGA